MAELENPYVLCPYHANRRLWDMLISAVVVYLIIFIPIEICVLWYEPSATKKALSYFMDALFWMDIILNFNTGFVHYGVLYMNRTDIARRYMAGWFIVDLIGNFPFELVLGDLEKSQRKSVKLLKWAKLPKLLRIGRVIKYMKQYIKFASILGLVFTAVFALHFLACLWIFLVYEEDDQVHLPISDAGFLCLLCFFNPQILSRAFSSISHRYCVCLLPLPRPLHPFPIPHLVRHICMLPLASSSSLGSCKYHRASFVSTPPPTFLPLFRLVFRLPPLLGW